MPRFGVPRFGIHPAMRPHYTHFTMMSRGSHPDVEYEVYDVTGRFSSVFKTFNEAAAYALIEAASEEGITIPIDVFVYSEGGAMFWDRLYGAAQYDELENNLIARIEVRGNVVIGRVL